MTPEEQAYTAVDPGVEVRPEQRRRLSWMRILVLVAVLAAATTGLLTVPAAVRSTAAPISSSMFMPYVDVTNTPWYPFDDATQPPSAWLALSFVVSGKTDACDPSWGGAYSLDEAAHTMDLDRRIARLRQVGGHVAVSFGGAANSELSVDCTNPQQLLDAYAAVVHRYSFNTIDFDIEGEAASAPDVSVRRATAIYKLQQQEKLAGRSLQVWLTLPVSPTGLTSTGQSVLAATLAAMVDLAGVNAMTMDYGSALPPGQSLGTANASALTGLAAQLTTAYQKAGVHVDADTVWQRIGATPMIGQNDIAAERFDLTNAQQLLLFANQHGLRRLSMWSVNRDQACGPNYPDVTIVSPNCSGVKQAPGAFAKAFGTFTTAGSAVAPKISTQASPLPTTSQEPPTVADNPATSPYPIWDPVLPYASGTKIVWHRNVYEAKWWTQGATPDEPVASTTQTPWLLIGPVLPGEHPQPTPTLKVGTYPAWSATATYIAGQRVLYGGVGYQAKWWTQGDVPGIVVGDPGQTPWESITNP